MNGADLINRSADDKEFEREVERRERDRENERIALADAALHGVCDMIATYPGCDEANALSALLHVFCQRALREPDGSPGRDLETLWPENVPAPWHEDWHDKHRQREINALVAPHYQQQYADARQAHRLRLDAVKDGRPVHEEETAQ